SFTLRYKTKAGANHGHTHTPDFFVLRRDSAGWEEWKMEDELSVLAEKMSARYVRSENEGWHCPPGEEYARQFGLYYRVRSSAEINWTLQRNLRFLEDYLRAGDQQRWISEPAKLSVISLLAAHPGMTLGELSGSAKATMDEIYLLLVSNEIFVDLCAAPLVDPACVRVFLDQEAAFAHSQITRLRPPSPADGMSSFEIVVGMELSWDGRRWRVINLGQSKVSLLDDQENCRELPQNVFDELVKRGSLRIITPAPRPSGHEKASEIINQAGPEALREATRRYRLIEPYLNGSRSSDQTLSARTRQRWMLQYRTAQATHGIGFLGLLPGIRGNPKPRLPEATRDLMNKLIEDSYETLKQKGKFVVYGQYLVECERQCVQAASYRTFATEINRRPKFEQALKRKGARAAYSHEPFYYELSPTVPRHGDRPFEIAHIDHTELDVELICTEPRRNLGRPWATFLTDAYSRRLLAVLLLYDPPSYRTNMMILRECVRRHHRFPQNIVVDGGKDFHSLYFDALLAAQECTKRIRPAGKSRFGSVIERLFGVSDQQFVHNLQGNTQITKNVRQVTKSVAPATQAIWTLPLLNERLCEWAYEVYDTSLHGRLEQSPRAAFESGMRMAGDRLHRMIQYDEAFRLLTLPTTRSGMARVVPNNGVKINNRYYWANIFRNAELGNTSVPVRYDPYDAGQAYAFVKGVWVTCHSEHYLVFRGRTEREIMLASSELRKRQSRGVTVFNASAKKLATFLTSVEAQETLLAQRLRDIETKKVLFGIDGELLLSHNPRSPLADATDPSPANFAQSPLATDRRQPAQFDEPELYSDY
ncbi:MAG: Mu transposase C-terminal domain-containing protein, partial [Acidobacteria bacterium]|nr:Mu transposase C-terminal domain-containing protein [Acidobacteriota bacterium]